MATVVMQGLTINGAEILVSWVNGFAKENLIKHQGDLIYWGRLAKEGAGKDVPTSCSTGIKPGTASFTACRSRRREAA